MKPNTERLRKLADHLLHGKLGHEKFDFSQYNNTEENICGAAGCAIGECPIAFPDDWEFGSDGEPELMAGEETELSGKIYFNLDRSQYRHLFLPEDQDTEEFGGEWLSDSATKEQVAHNILEFCKLYE
ncbi:MAG: hypothetical protein V4490_05645 [Pseudomonadota bacterium]